MYKENPRSFFLFFILSNFHFALMNAQIYVERDQGIHKGEKWMLLEMKNEKTASILFLHKHSKFLSVLVWQKLKQKPLISEEWSKLRQWNNENQLSFLEEEEKISLRNIWRNKMKILVFSHGIQISNKEVLS